MKWLFAYFLPFLILVAVLNVHFSTQLLSDDHNASRGKAHPYFVSTKEMSTDKKPASHQRGIQDDINDNDKPRRILIIAAVPRSAKHVVGLWSELECFTSDVDRVVISGPTWSHNILDQVVAMAKERITRFSNHAEHSVSLESLVFVNDRYDVGLWCDALEYMEQNKTDGRPSLSAYDEVGLLNDSVFAMREYNKILSSLQEMHAHMTSLSYSFYGPSFKGYGLEHKWLESVWRGFDREGLHAFQHHSCLPKADDKKFCPKKKGWRKKKCIIDNFERAMSQQFQSNATFGLFLSDTPERLLTEKEWFNTWVQHPTYWKELVATGFPVAKINVKDMIKDIDDDRLKTCTGRLERTILDRLDFSVATKKR